MSDSVDEVTVRASGGAIRVRVTIPKTPHNLAAVLWRYDSNKQPVSNQPSGEFSRKDPEVPIGSASSVRDNFFLIEGAVLHNSDNPPVQYQVEVAILQGQTVLHEQVPEGGSGQISDSDKAFAYRFHITEAP